MKDKNLWKSVIAIILISVLTACVSLGSERLSATSEVFTRNYSSIKQIAIEEAANNGFGTLTSEVKPSEFNDWKGQLFFQLVTTNGTDQLFVKFSENPEGIDIWIHGAGTRANPDSAAKAISARIAKLK
jgi:hypothetical protein